MAAYRRRTRKPTDKAPSAAQDGNGTLNVAQDANGTRNAVQDDPYAPLLEHAVRWWNAEEENARRLANRVNLNLTVIAAFLGLGVVQFLTDHDLHVRAGRTATYLFLVGIGLLGYAALHLLSVLPLKKPNAEEEKARKRKARIRRRRLRCFGLGPLAELFEEPVPLAASSHFRFSEDFNNKIENVPVPTPGTSMASRATAYFHTYEAATNLARLNIEEEQRINRGQRRMLWGFASIFLAVMLFTIGDDGPDGEMPGAAVYVHQVVHGGEHEGQGTDQLDAERDDVPDPQGQEPEPR